MIVATLNDLELPPIERQFIQAPSENATDVTVLSGELYTDFVSQEQSWVFNYDLITKDQYDAIRAIYDSQFTLFSYPTLSIPFFLVEDQPVRMYINDKDIWNNCGDIQNVELRFRQTAQLSEES